MDSDSRSRLLALAQSDSAVMAALQAATTAQEITRIANDHGIELTASDLAADADISGAELSEAELEAVSGGTILHPTMSVFCGTNGNFCTFNPYACQSAG